MSYLDSLPDDATLLDAFKRSPESAALLMQYHEILLRGESALTVAERELIAAYVSGLNACGYCHGIHRETARQFGVDGGLLESMVEDLDAAPVDDKIRAILGYVRKLTLEPSRVTRSDADAVRAAGWDDAALFDAVRVCALFNFMNRYVQGLGIEADSQYAELASTRLHDQGYATLVALLRGE